MRVAQLWPSWRLSPVWMGAVASVRRVLALWIARPGMCCAELRLGLLSDGRRAFHGFATGWACEALGLALRGLA